MGWKKYLAFDSLHSSLKTLFSIYKHIQKFTKLMKHLVNILYFSLKKCIKYIDYNLKVDPISLNEIKDDILIITTFLYILCVYFLKESEQWTL